MTDLYLHISGPRSVCRLQSFRRLFVTTIDNPRPGPHQSISASFTPHPLRCGHICASLSSPDCPASCQASSLLELLGMDLLCGACLQTHRSVYALIALCLPREVANKIQSRNKCSRLSFIYRRSVQIDGLQSDWTECKGSLLDESSITWCSVHLRVTWDIKWPTCLTLLNGLHYFIYFGDLF